jgi:hypothetical protein
VLCELAAGVEPSGFVGAGVVCFVSELLVVVFSVELVGAGALLAAGGGFTTVVGGGVC